ncbi:MAG: hypothetical protein LIO60_01125, partial [Oscillospiraceae bacterium]|nr:hypothetical protein [Oscillospiraceae bacterium]
GAHLLGALLLTFLFDKHTLWNTQMQISAKKSVAKVYHNARRLSSRTADYFRATASIFKAALHKSAEANPCPQRQTPCSMHEQTTKKSRAAILLHGLCKRLQNGL